MDLAFKNIDFAMNLYCKISSYHDKNFIFSPLSVSMSFAMLLLAAKGSTHSQIEKGLNLDSLDGTGDATLIPQLFEQLQKNITQNIKTAHGAGHGTLRRRALQHKESLQRSDQDVLRC
ncbi:hypothetical protein cypCar_00033969 [Cyprinus carpio]|nr:hypothetical protein cypCar_00033969 [Cyprinus carpio]